jgi:hypothetical protein
LEELLIADKFQYEPMHIICAGVVLFFAPRVRVSFNRWLGRAHRFWGAPDLPVARNVCASTMRASRFA